MTWAGSLMSPGRYEVEVVTENAAGQLSSPAVLALDVLPEAWSRPSTCGASSSFDVTRDQFATNGGRRWCWPSLKIQVGFKPVVKDYVSETTSCLRALQQQQKIPLNALVFEFCSREDMRARTLCFFRCGASMMCAG